MFQSTRPVWGATFFIRSIQVLQTVSIHAPRVGRDGRYGKDFLSKLVSIHAPRVGRDDVFHKVIDFPQVSIHAPRVGRDITAPGTIFRPI